MEDYKNPIYVSMWDSASEWREMYNYERRKVKINQLSFHFKKLNGEQIKTSIIRKKNSNSKSKKSVELKTEKIKSKVNFLKSFVKFKIFY